MGWKLKLLKSLPKILLVVAIASIVIGGIAYAEIHIPFWIRGCGGGCRYKLR